MRVGASGSAAQAGSSRFTRRDRLRKRFEFRRARDAGRRVHTASFTLLVVPNGLAEARLGITVTRRVAGAVGRNRIKRLVREAFRTRRGLFPAGGDVVFIARESARDLSLSGLLAELQRAKAGLAAGLTGRPQRAMTERPRRERPRSPQEKP